MALLLCPLIQLRLAVHDLLYSFLEGQVPVFGHKAPGLGADLPLSTGFFGSGLSKLLEEVRLLQYGVSSFEQFEDLVEFPGMELHKGLHDYWAELQRLHREICSSSALATYSFKTC